MKKAILFYCFVFAAPILPAQDFWMQRDSVNGAPKAFTGSFTAWGEGYIVSGLEYPGFTRKMYSYNPVQDDWDNEQSIGGDNGGGLSRGSAVAFSLYEKGYICTGQGDNTNFLKDMWEYDPVADVWTQRADFPGSARRGAVAFVINNIAYVGTGEDVTGLRKDFFRYDPVNNIWGVVADFAGTPRKQAAAFSMGGQGFVGTGFDGTMRNDFWQYFEFQNMWVQKANFPGTPRAGAAAWSYFPGGFIATGEDNTYTYTSDVWEYNYFNEQWTQRAVLPAPGRKGATAFVINGLAYLGTGYNGVYLDDFYVYQGVVGVDEKDRQDAFRAYPNPAHEKICISHPGFGTKNYSLRFYSADGKQAGDLFEVSYSAGTAEVLVRRIVPGNYWYAATDASGRMIGSGSFIIR